MAYYITYGEFQNYMKTYYLKTNSRMEFWEMRDYLYSKNLLSQTLPSSNIFIDNLDNMSDEEFNTVIDSITMTLYPKSGGKNIVSEKEVIPNFKDVFVIRHPRYTKSSLHKHNYFEINYVSSGSCKFTFENETKVLNKGQFCIISPFSEHDIVIDDDSTIFCIMLRKSTFNTSFFHYFPEKTYYHIFLEIF